ncbi:ATP-dependent endonuclease [Pseudonocardia alni]|uniref:ATP-dependent nuclease n=1 Tax=Pseudonocardia alni TaxID=33907 RepID=UPI00371AB858
MRVRRVEINNFRGIASLDWRIPADKKFICLVGPGDSRKSTIVDAIYYTLGDRWALAFSDTDFFNADVQTPINIRVALASLPPEIRSHKQLGMDLSGIDAQGNWVHDPEDGYEPCVVVQLQVTHEMEPAWTLYRPGGHEANQVGAGTRRRFSVFRVDDRIDNHLRWTRTSALTRLTDASHGTTGTLATANRAAREAVAGSVTPELRALTGTVQERLSQLGSGAFTNLQPGLDVNSAAGGGNLALFEGEVPLTSYGLGTRRLAGITTQEMASESKSVILIDEIEHGLEPHRLVHLLKHLRSEGRPAQVFTTTHSPVAVEQLNSSDLAVIRSNHGQVTAAFIPDDLKFGQAALRGGPSAFLAHRVVVTEGKTEFGIMLGLLDEWDPWFNENGAATSAALGVAVTNGGGASAPRRAMVLKTLGYEVALFLDHDVPAQKAEVDAAIAAGVEVFRWTKGRATEDELVHSLDAVGLTELLKLAVTLNVDEVTVRSGLLNRKQPDQQVADLDVVQWIAGASFTLESARTLICLTARKQSWFKDIAKGRVLGSWVQGKAAQAQFKESPFWATVVQVGEFIYRADKPASTPPPSDQGAGASA